LNHITGAFLCQFFLSRTKIHKNTVIPTIKQLFISLSYFYIVSRQEETRFQLVLKTPTKTLKLIVISLNFFLIISLFFQSLYSYYHFMSIFINYTFFFYIT